MQHTTRLLLTVLALSLGLFAASARAAEGKIIKLIGSATLQIPGQPDQVITEGMPVPEGATIVTAADAEVHVQPFEGTVSTIKGGSTVTVEELSVTKSGGAVTKQSALLNLKSGNLVSTLDPAKKNINSYGVRTPKGVAAARGTSYSVSVTAGGFSIAATADTVSFTTATGATYSIQAGMVSITLPGGEPQPPVPLATVAVSNPEVAAVVRDAVQTISEVVTNNLGGLSAESATNLITQVASVATTALPAEAASIATTVVTAVTAPTASTATSAQASAVAAAAVTSAVVQAAPAAAAAVTTAAVSAVTSATAATAGTAESAAVAAAAVTAAAITAAPGEAASITSAAVTAAPTASGAITAAATTAAPTAAAEITAAVVSVTSQTTEQVQAAAAAAASTAAQATATAATATATAAEVTTNVVTPTSTTTTTTTTTTETQQTTQQNQQETTPTTDIDPSTRSTSG